MSKKLNVSVQAKTIRGEKPFVEFTLVFQKPDCTLKCHFEGDLMVSEWVSKGGYELNAEFLATCVEIIDQYMDNVNAH